MAEGCCYVDADGDRPKVCETTVRKAAKEHTCCECGRTIPKGAKYEHVSGIWDPLPGRVWTRYKTCWTCTLIRDEYCEGGFYYGELREILLECKGFDYVTNELTSWAEEEDGRQQTRGTNDVREI